MMQFRHPMNQYGVTVRAPRLWALLFGPLYFAYHGAWSQTLISTVVVVMTGGLAWVVYPFFSPGIIRSAYLQQGWQERTT